MIRNRFPHAGLIPNARPIRRILRTLSIIWLSSCERFVDLLVKFSRTAPLTDLDSLLGSFWHVIDGQASSCNDNASDTEVVLLMIIVRAVLWRLRG